MSEIRRLLLVGGTGRVGRMVQHHWDAEPPKGAKIIHQHRDQHRSDGLYWDVSEGPDDELGALDIDTIVCLAGVTPGGGKDLSLNSVLAQNVLRAAHRAGIGRVLLASSSAVYGAGTGVPFHESDELNPDNAYGEAKIEMEKLCAEWRDKEIEICCLRIGNVAGADALLCNVANLAPDQPVTIDCFSDGRGPIRSYIGAGSLAKALSNLAIQQGQLPQTLNVGAPFVVAMEDLARAAGHPFEFQSAPFGAQQRIVLDCQALAKLHEFEPNASDATEMVVQWKESLPK